MSKELELFQQIVKGYTEMFNTAIHHPKDTIVKWEGVEEIEKALKALEIIKEKMVDVEFLIGCYSYDYDLLKYNLNRQIHLTQEEYDLLKEVLL